jgi:hypothetical protein
MQGDLVKPVKGQGNEKQLEDDVFDFENAIAELE